MRIRFFCILPPAYLGHTFEGQGINIYLTESVIIMKKTFLSLLSLSAPVMLGAQCLMPVAQEVIDANNLSVRFLNAGDMFWDANSTSQFFHKIDSANTFFAGALWMGAWDDGGNLCAAAQTYRQIGNDYWAGPLASSNGQAIDSTCTYDYDRIWKVTRADIETLAADWNDNGLIDNAVPQSLYDWPGRGNPHFAAAMGFQLPDQDLAPFYDRNSDGIYNPIDGDYPIYEDGNGQAVADQMLWMVFNDYSGLHTVTNGQPMVAEIQHTVYSFNCAANPLLQNTIFSKYKVISRNALTLRDAYFGIWTDIDLGCYNNDYMGCSPAHNAVYGYNQTDHDSIQCNAGNNPRGFGAHPPVQAITFLNRSMAHNNIFRNDASPMSAPAGGLEFYRALEGLHRDGSAFTDNDGNVSDFLFPDAPSDTAGWSMVHNTSSFQPISDMSQLMTTHIDTFASGGVYFLDVAYSYHRDTTLHSPAAMVDMALQEVEQIQQIFDGGFQLPCAIFNSVEQTKDLDKMALAVRVYPNPAQDKLTIELEREISTSIDFVMYDVLGNLHLQQSISPFNKQLQIEQLQLPNGLYFYALSAQGKSLASGKVMVQR